MKSNSLKALMDRHTGPLDPIPTQQPLDLPKLPNIRAVVFDVYGTMLVSGCGEIGSAVAVDRSQAAQETLDEMDLHPQKDAGSACVQWLGETIQADHLNTRQSGIEFPEVEIRDIWQTVLNKALQKNLIKGEPNPTMVSVAYECRVNPVWPMPNLQTTLQAIHDAGLQLGIVSNAQFFTPLLMEYLCQRSLAEIGFHDDRCIWSFQHKEAKPSVRLYRWLTKKMPDLSPDQILYVGNDMRNDIRPAAACGLRTALFAGDQRSLRLRKDDPTCQNIQPDATVQDLSQLLEIAGVRP